MDIAKRTVTLTVAPGDELAARMRAALAGRRREPRIGFASVDPLHGICAPKRLAVLRAMAGFSTGARAAACAFPMTASAWKWTRCALPDEAASDT